jgi:transcriptional regulator with XRE-family HTH domain
VLLIARAALRMAPVDQERVWEVAEVIGGNIRDLRRAAGLSQSDLARAMGELGFGWVRQTVGEVEAGRRRLEYDELVALAAYFDMPVNAILGSPGGSPPYSTVRVGNKVVRLRTWKGLVAPRNHMEPAGEHQAKAADDLMDSLPRPWAKRWRKSGEAPGIPYKEAREEALGARTRHPGPIFVLTGKGSGEIGVTEPPWATSITITLKSGEPYVARDELEAEELERLEARGIVRRIRRDEAYRLRKAKGEKK